MQVHQTFPLPPGATTDAGYSDTAGGFFIDIKLPDAAQAITFWNAHLPAAGYAIAAGGSDDMLEFSGPGCQDGGLVLDSSSGATTATLDCRAH